MKRREAGGRIVFVSSESRDSDSRSKMIHYGFTKTAQLAISRGPRGGPRFGTGGNRERCSSGTDCFRRLLTDFVGKPLHPRRIQTAFPNSKKFFFEKVRPKPGLLQRFETPDRGSRIVGLSMSASFARGRQTNVLRFGWMEGVLRSNRCKQFSISKPRASGSVPRHF